MINEALASGKTPIVDATHLNIKYLQEFAFWSVPVELVWFDINPGTAFERINLRVRKVSKEVLDKQYSQYKQLKKRAATNPEDFGFAPVKLEQNIKLPKCVIFDIDGTLARMNFRNPYDWHLVDTDSVDLPTAQMLKDLYESGNTKILICTGRDGVCLNLTQTWLKNNNIPYHGIFIRPKGDQRPDWVVKEEIWRKIIKMYYIEYLIDDRNQVVRRGRALGLKIFQAEYGNF